MSKSFLITRPQHDDTTHYLSAWAEEVKKLAEKKNIQVLDCKKEKANQNTVTGLLSKKNPLLVFFNGHGNHDCVTGHKNEELIRKGVNEYLLKEKIIYAVSCRSAKELGPASVNAGAKTYLGYDDDFILIYEPNKISNPLHDKTAKLFLEPSNELAVSLVKSNTCSEAEKRSKQMFKERISKLLTSEAKPEDTTLVRYLWWDMKHQVIHGDGGAIF